MPTKKTLIRIVLIFVISFSTIFFIIGSNDHIECCAIVKKAIDENGNQITTKEHICKEKYSF